METPPIPANATSPPSPRKPRLGDFPHWRLHRLTHSGLDVFHFFGLHLRGAVFPVTAAALLFGWRALGLIAVVVGCAAIAIRFWKRIGLRGAQLRYSHGLWMATLLALTLPVHLFSHDGSGATPWPMLPAAGLLIIIVTWTLGGLASASVHPVLVSHLALVILFGSTLTPWCVLQRHNLFFGDAIAASDSPAAQGAAYSWLTAPLDDEHDAIRTDPASLHLGLFTIGRGAQNQGWLALEGLLRDRMPPLEDLIFGGHPGPIGTTSAVAVILGGLFLIYRGVSNFRVPLLIILSAAVILLILPIPVAVSGDARTWRWLAMFQPGIGWPTALTFVNYELLASPLLFMAFFLATDPSVRPTTPGGQALFAVLVGSLTAFLQLYAAVSWGPYLALLVVSLLSRMLDEWLRVKPLV